MDIKYTATASLLLDCGHEAQIAFVGDEPQADIECPVCGFTDLIDNEQLITIKQRLYDAAKADLLKRMGERFGAAFKQGKN